MLHWPRLCLSLLYVNTAKRALGILKKWVLFHLSHRNPAGNPGCFLFSDALRRFYFLPAGRSQRCIWGLQGVKPGNSCRGDPSSISGCHHTGFCFLGQTRKTRSLNRTCSLGREGGRVLLVPGRKHCGERPGAYGLPDMQETVSGGPLLSIAVCGARPCAPWLLGQPLVSGWEAFWWSPDLPMGDARHGAEGSAESPERGGVHRTCPRKKGANL